MTYTHLIKQYINMRKINLKKTRYNKFSETIFGIVVSTAFLCMISFEMLSGTTKLSDANLIGGFVLFSICLIFYLWRLVAKKSQAHYININGWQYRLFRKVSKWQFICISGFLSSARIGVIVVVLLFSSLIKNELSPWQAILITIALCVIATVPYGYMNYKIFTSVDMDSDVSYPFYKK